MNRIVATVLGLVGALALASPALAASGKAAALKRELGPGVRVAAHVATGQVRFVGAAAGRAIPSGASRSASPRAAAREFLAAHGKAFGIADQAKDLRVESSHAAARGRSSVRFQQLLDGIPVLGGELVVNLDGDRNVLAASGELLPGSVARTPRVTAAAARAEAVAAVAKERSVSKARLDGTAPSLWVYDARLLGGPGPQAPTLVWRLDVEGDSGLAIDDLVLIDAERGNLALRIEQIEQALDRRVCDANNTSAQYPCTAPVATEADPPTAGDDPDVGAAFEFAGDTYNFFAGFGRDSLDDQGLPLTSTIDYCEPGFACPFANAFWDGSQMVYGDGFASADDVVGHELTHGVTEFSAHLFYYFQSGAINESLSDVFGEFIDLTNGAGTDTAGVRWQIGEDLPGGPGRDMEDPPAFGDPDRMGSGFYTSDPNEVDSGGVHTNSGVNNKAAFLIADGGTFNGRSVTGLGIPKASRIYYDVQTQFLTSGSDYADLGSALPQACDDLVGTIGITAANCTEVRDAVAATEMASQPAAAPAPEAPAAVCPGGQVRTDLFLDDMEGSTNWTTNDLARWGFLTDYAHSGVTSLFGADSSARSDTVGSMTGSVAIPADASSAFLRFDHSYGFEDNASGTAFDGGVLEISTNGGASYSDIGALLTDVGYNGTIASTALSDNPLASRPAFVRESNGYRASRATLTSLRGQSVRFRFRIGTDTGVGGAGWFIDDVHIYSCSPPPPPPPPDGDGDGVPDAGDACPSTPATTPDGCPAGESTPGGGTPGGGTPGGGSSTTTLASARVRSCRRTGKGKKTRVRCTLRGFGAVRRATVTVKRNGKTVARRTVRPTSRGVLSIKPRKPLRRGTYKVKIVLRDAAGNRRTLRKTFKVK